MLIKTWMIIHRGVDGKKYLSKMCDPPRDWTLVKRPGLNCFLDEQWARDFMGTPNLDLRYELVSADLHVDIPR